VLVKVPAFVTEDGVKITQSVAIMEFLEEIYPDKKTLLPKDPKTRAKVKLDKNMAKYCFKTSFLKNNRFVRL